MMSRSLAVVSVTLCTLLSASAAGARTWIVALDGSGDFTLISAACTAAASGDTIRIRPGQYDEPDYAGPDKPWFRVQDKSLTIIGDGVNPEDVLITFALGFIHSSSNIHIDVFVRGVGFLGPAGRLGLWADRLDVGSCTFEGTGNGPPAGWGEMPLSSYSVASALVHDCVFRDNVAYGFASAINIAGPDQTIRNCRFENNSTNADDAGALHVDQGPAEGPCIVEGCVFLGNKGPRGAAIGGTRTIVRNCTFYGNDGGCMYMSGDGNVLDHSIVTATRNGGVYGSYGTFPILLSCSDIWGNDLGDPPGPGPFEGGSFSLDPLLCDPTNGDVTLHADSPCVNAPGCGLVGAEGIGCAETPTTAVTWGRLKTVFR